ncbi:helix-turn-helix transcriptional regulator [Silanimonas sp.]|jgi:predicted DNA-binding transcriptional regulator YafY|uniref:helix-turn-helix transcriptional regulator n=1 Tax=Silanimonas sp. TaxID=1929290 RepID=UPI0037C591B0
MAKSPETLYRHWRILELLPASPGSTTAPALWARLQDEGFQCTKRTVERDLEVLSGHHPLVADDSEKPFRWSFAHKTPQRVVPGLTPAQAVALALARDHLGALLPKHLADSLEPLYRTADAVMEELGWKRWVEATAFVPPTQRLVPAKYDTEVLFSIQKAIAENRRLQIRYRKKWADAAKDREINPLGVQFGGPVSYLVATDAESEQPKQFALHRIESTRLVDARRHVPKGFSFKDYARSSETTWLHEPSIKLVLWIDPPASEHLRETPLSKDQTWRRLKKANVVEITATVDDTEQLRWWILSFGNQIVVRSPKSVHAAIARAQTVVANQGDEDERRQASR